MYGSLQAVDENYQKDIFYSYESIGILYNDEVVLVLYYN